MKRAFALKPWIPACAGMLFLLFATTTAALAATLTFPALTGRVVDDAHILRAGTIQTLTSTLAAHEQSSGEQVVVVTLPSLQDQDIAEYGYQLGRAWGIGQQGKNTGALIIVAPKEHKARIEVGYGLEGTLTDAASADIVQNTMLPAFKRGDYDGGITAGTQAVLGVLGGDAASAETVQDNAVQQESGGSPPLLLFFIIAILFFIVSRFTSRRRGGGLAPLVLGGLLGGFGGGGSGGGGGFSGGGGSFGGGGASGSW